MNGNGSKSRSLILMTALLAVVILVAAWFLLLSPVLGGAAEANTDAEEQEQVNANTQVEVNKLREQFAHIDEYQAQLTALQVQIPTAPLYPELQRMFSDVAVKYGVVITTLQFGTATEFEAAAPPSATDEGTGTTPEPSATPAPAPSADPGTDDASAAPKPPQGLYAIPVSLTILGKYDDVLSALKELQTADGRLVLISDVTLTRDAEDTTGVGVGSGVKGADTSGVYAGSVFVLTSSTPPEVAPGASTSPSPSPSPSS